MIPSIQCVLKHEFISIRPPQVEAERASFNSDRSRSMHSSLEAPEYKHTPSVSNLLADALPSFWNGFQSEVAITVATSIEEQIIVGD